MVTDPTAPATKRDMAMVMEHVGGLYVHLEKRVIALEESLDKRFTESEGRMVQQFHVIAEQIHHDAIGANRDEIEVVKDRVTRLERHTGLLKR